MCIQRMIGNLDVKGMKIGIPRDYFGEGLDPEVRDAVLAMGTEFLFAVSAPVLISFFTQDKSMVELVQKLRSSSSVLILFSPRRSAMGANM